MNSGVAFDAENFAAAKAAYEDMADIIGIFEAKAAAADGLDDAAIESLIQERLAARQAKNWARADEIRDALKAKGIVLEDSSAGTRWKQA